MGDVVWDCKVGEAIYMEMENQIFGKQMFAGTSFKIQHRGLHPKGLARLLPLVQSKLVT